MRYLDGLLDTVERIVRAAPMGDEVERARVFDEVSQAMFGTPRPPPRLGRYRLLERLGGGGQGVVHAAWDPQLNRRVAIKVLRVGADAAAATRLRREAMALAQLAHPNVIAIHDVGGFSGGIYMVMQLIPGQTLAQWLRTPRSPRHVLAVFDGAARGLVAAHRRGIVHRDFKPANVWVGDDGVPRLLDFGLALPLAMAPSERSGADDDTIDGSRMTATGHVVGTPAYMATEQHDGQDATPASDQYSWCASLFEALYGTAPFGGDSLEELVAAKRRFAIESPAPGHPHSAKRLHGVIVRGLNPDPGLRWPSMEALLRALDDKVDRGRRVRTTAPWFGATLAAGIWIAQPDDSDRCSGRAPIRWSEAEAQSITAAIEGSGLPFAHDVAGRVTSTVGRVVDEWDDARRVACSTLGDDDAADGKVACLDQVAHELDDIVAILETGSIAVVSHADELLDSLPQPGRCTTELDDDDPRRAAIARAIARARALATAEETDEALELSRTSLSEAEATGDDHLVATAAAVYGDVLLDRGRHVDAVAMLESAYLHAVAAGDDSTAFSAALGLVGVLASSRQDPVRCGEWVDRATASWTRVTTGDPGEQGRLALARARWQFTSAQYAAAVDSAAEAAALLEDADDLLTVHALELRARTLANLGRNTEALTTAQRAVEVAERMRGPDHPSTAGVLLTLATMTSTRGDPATALAMLARVQEVQTRVWGPDDGRVAEAMRQSANVKSQLGRHSEAAEGYREVLEIQRRHRSADDPMIAQTLYNLAESMRALGDREEAATLGRESVRIAEAKLGGAHPTTAIYLHGLGQTISSSDRAEAIGLLERACAIARDELGVGHHLYRTFDASLAEVRGSVP